MADQIDIVKVDPNGGSVFVDVTFPGTKQWARYAFYLYPPTLINGEKFGDGVNADQIPDVHQVPGSPAQLTGCGIFWQMLFMPLGGTTYAANVQISQQMPDQRKVLWKRSYQAHLPSQGVMLNDWIKTETA